MDFKKLIFLGLIVFIGCDNFKNQPKVQPKQANIFAIKIRDYINDNIDGNINPSREPRFEIIDSVKLIALNSILYKVDDEGTIDDADYFLIQDCGNDEIHSITNRHWPSFNSEADRDLQVQILSNKESGKNIELVNYDYLGLESFLNRSSELKKRPISDLELDTMIRFMGDNELMRITKIEELDTLISKIDRNEDKESGRFEYEHFIKMRPILEKKIKEKNILLYRLYWNSLLEYFEILPFVSNSFCQEKLGKEKEQCEKEMSDSYKRVVKGGFYNLKMMRIR